MSPMFIWASGLPAGAAEAGSVLAEVVNRRRDHQRAHDAAGHHDGADPRADDVADAEKLGGHVAR